MPDYAAVIAAAQEAATMALQPWRDGAEPAVKIWEKSKGNPVSEIDMAVDSFLKQRLGALDAQAAWLSEETADNAARLEAERVWLVDPIDGTRDYVRGRSGWCVSIALIERGQPIFAVMAAPAQGKLWVARRGMGTHCNGVRLVASQRSQFAGARVPTDELPKVDRDLLMVEKPNSIAMRMTMVACDRADLVATLRWGHEWDIAAAHLVAQEAGAKITTAKGSEIRYNKPDPRDFGLICAAPDIHSAAVERLAERADVILSR